LGLQKVAVMYGNDDAFTKSGYDVFAQAIADEGLEVVATETFAKGDTDFSAQLTKIQSPMGTINPVSSLTGTNSTGETERGRLQRRHRKRTRSRERLYRFRAEGPLLTGSPDPTWSDQRPCVAPLQQFHQI